MFVQKVVLHHIRSYTDATIEFSEGSTLLSGDIGSGKSTIFSAIEFGLFGLSRGDIEGSALLRNGEKRGFVEVWCIIQKKSVKIKRTLVRTKTGVNQETGTIEIDGSLEELSATEIRSRVLSLLQYPTLSPKATSLLFRYTVYCGQEQMKHILHVNAENRIEIMRSIFALDKYRIVRENARTFSRNFKHYITRYQTKMEDFTKVEDELENMQKQKDLFETQYTQKEQEKLVQQKKKKDAESVYLKMQELHTKYEQQKSHLEQMQKQLQTLGEKEQKYTRELEELNAKIQNIDVKKPIAKPDEKIRIRVEEEKTSLLKRISSYEKDREFALSQKKVAEAQIGELEKKQKVLEEKIVQFDTFKNHIRELHKERKTYQIHEKQKYAELLQTLQQKFQKKEYELDDIQTQISIFHDHKTCPTCKQQITDSYKNEIMQNHTKTEHELITAKKHLWDLLNQTQKTYDTILEQEEKVRKIDRDIAVFTEKIAGESDVQIDLEDVKQKISAVKKEILQYEKNDTYVLDDLRKQLAHCEENIAEFRKQEIAFTQFQQRQVERDSVHKNSMYVSELQKTCIQEKKTLQAECEKLQLISFNQEEFEQKKSQYIKEQEQYEQIISEVEKLKSSLTQCIEHVQKLTEQKAEKQNIQKKLSKYKSMDSWLHTLFIPLMQTIEQAKFQQVLQEFSHTFSHWFSILIEDESMYAQIDNSFSPIIIQNGCEMDIHSLSGGEKTSVALAYRLSIHNVINHIHTQIQTKDILLLDEPTDGFSHEQLDRVRIVLDELAVKQLFIVSHEPKIESFVHHVKKIQKKQHRSVVF
ncbi:MAG: AAA family ATPase [Candidatus Woesearchaeota archaeon]